MDNKPVFWIAQGTWNEGARKWRKVDVGLSKDTTLAMNHMAVQVYVQSTNMPINEESHLFQHAVVWDYTGNVDANGQPIVNATPRQVSARWLDSKGQQITIDQDPGNDDVTAILLCDVAVKSMMRYGRLADLPEVPNQIMEVIGFKKTPDLKNRYHRRVATLRKFGDKLPKTQ